MHGMHRISPAFVPKNAAQSGDEERREAIRLLSPRADISSPLALRNSHNESGNDSTPRAKFLKAVADDRIAMHACTIDDLARLLEDADSAATSENVLKTAISLAINDIRERFAKAESTAKEEIECAAKEKSNAIISALKQEHQCVVDALILAQRDAMSSAVENEQVFIQHIAQLEKRLQEENQRKFDLKTRNEELEMTIADSALKLSRLDNVVGRASSLEKAVKEAWDRVIYTESKLKDQEAELADSVSQRFELQTLARSLESTLQVAEATLVTNHEAALKEKENFEKTIAQLRLDLNLSRDAVERARAQTDLMIGQLARGQAEKSAIVEAHAASLNCILARSTELEELHNDETARYFCLQNQLKVSNESVALAESRASAASEALESLKQEFAEFCSASESDSVRSLAMLNMLEIEFADFKSASQTKLVAAFSKEAAMEEEIKRLRDLVQEGTDIRASSASIVLQLEAKLQDSETETFALRNALQFALSDLNAAKIEMADLVAKNKEIEESNDVQPLSLMSTAEGLDAASKFIECAGNPTHDNTSCIAAIESTVTNGVHSVPHAKTVVQSSLLPPSLGLSQSPHLLPAEGTIGSKYDVKTSNGSPAKYDDALLCNGSLPFRLDQHQLEIIHSRNTTADALISSASPDHKSTSSSPAEPLSTPVSSPLDLQPAAAETALSEHSVSSSEVSSHPRVPVIELANVMRIRLNQSQLVSPTSPVFSPTSDPKLARSQLLLSPRSDSDSQEGTLCASSDPCQVHDDTLSTGAHSTSGDMCESLDSENGAPAEIDFKSCTLRGSATSASGSKVTWVYHGLVNKQKLPEGHGARTFSNGEMFEGSWKAGLPHGPGRTLHADGAVYVGEYKNGQKEGQGSCTYPNGSVHNGMYLGGVKSGYGTCTWQNGNVFSGAYANDRMHGGGTFRWASGHIYSGEFANDRRHGQGTLISESGRRQSGQWNKGVFVAESE